MARVVILSGAGLSAESGISTFRDSGGLWDEHDVSVICNFDSMQKNRDVTVAFYDKQRSNLKFKQANHAHETIVQIKKKYKDEVAVITQNIDNLFEKAGMDPNDVIHLHGFLPEVRCMQCDRIYDIGYENLENFNGGSCLKCGGDLRPNIVFFGEQAPKYQELNKELSDCEMFVVIGTSGAVIGVNHIAQYVDFSILNNLESSESINDRLFTKVLYKKATEAIDEIFNEIDMFLA